MKIIYLTQGIITTVSDCDYERLNKYKWYAKKSAYNWYAARSDYSNGKQTTIRMHRFIMNCPKNMEVHHPDRGSLNNQRENLVVTTKSQNRSFQAL